MPSQRSIKKDSQRSGPTTAAQDIVNSYLNQARLEQEQTTIKPEEIISSRAQSGRNKNRNKTLKPSDFKIPESDEMLK